MLQAGPVGVGRGEPRDNPEDSLDAIHRLRYQVYCLERQFLDLGAHPEGRETDEYDRYAVHFAATDETGELVATLRLVVDSPLGFPLEHRAVSLFPEFTRLRRALTGEISRLILARQQRGVIIAEPLLLFGLLKELYEESRRLGLDGLLATMEDGLARLVRRLGFQFRPIGPCMDYFGPVTPYWAPLDTLEPGYRKIIAHQHRVAERAATAFRFFNVRTATAEEGLIDFEEASERTFPDSTE
jgi:N-acyl-L-homoserine lactone synthetase